MRKPFSAAVAAATIVWSLSLAALLTPLTAYGASSGSLVKASTAAVYYVGDDGKRYVFPNQTTYKTWYPDFSGVITLTDGELAAMTIGGNVCMRPGVLMAKITTDPKVYAVDQGCTLRWVPSEAAASALYGADWNKKIVDVPDAFFTNYSVGADLADATDFSPSAATATATSINKDKGIGTSAIQGTLSVSLAPTNPPSNTFVGGIGASMMEIAVTNTGASAATVNSLTLHRRGPGTASDFAGVYLFSGYDRISNAVTVNAASQNAVFNGINVTVAPGATEVISVIGTFNYFLGGNNQHAFDLTDLKSGNLSASGLPLSGNVFTMSQANSGLVTINRSGASPLSNVTSGGKHQKIGEFTFSLDGTEDMDFASLALTHGGTVPRERLSNLTLENGGTVLATAAGYDRFDRSTFVLEVPMTLQKGTTRTFQAYADIAPESRGGVSETVFTYIDDVVDVAAYGHVYGLASGVTTQTVFGGSYDGDGCALGAGNCSSTRIEAGTLTTAFNGPTADDASAGAKGVELFNFTMSAQANLDVRKLQLVLNGDGVNPLDNGTLTSPRITNVRIVDTATGSAVMGPKDSTNGTGYLAGATASTLDFTEAFLLNAGQSRTFKVVADISNATTLGALSKVRVTLSKLSALSGAVKNLDTNQNLTSADYVPDSVIAGNQFSLEAASLTVSAASSPVAQSYVKGSQGVALMGILLKAGEGSAATVSSLQLQGRIDSSNNSGVCTNAPNGTFSNGQEPAGCASVADNVQSLSLWNGSAQVGTVKTPASGTNGSFTFDNLNLTIAAGQTLALTLKGNLSNSQTAGTLPDDLQFQLSGSGVSVTDADGNAVTATGAATGPTMSVTDAGSITTATSSDSSAESDAGLLTGTSSNVTLARFRFSAQYEDLKLTKARVNVATPSAVSSISLYDGSTLVGGPVSVDGSGNADFSNMTGFVIARDSSKYLTVKATLSAVGPSGAPTGSDVTATLKDTAGTLEIRGAGPGSNTLITSMGGDKVGNLKIVRKTLPTVTLVSLPSTTLSAGNQVVLRFTVSADAAGEVALGKITADVTSSGTVTVDCVGGCGASHTQTVKRVGGDYVSADVAYAGNVLTVKFDTEETVSAGTSRTYEIHMNMTSALPSDSVSSSIRNDAANMTDTFANVDAAPKNFVWSDSSASSHGFTTADWASGFKVRTLPTDSQTLVK